MQPKKSMLKFRLSWQKGKTTYLAGDIYFPIWGPITTTEARLVPSEGEKEYDNAKYFEQMFYFNTITRVALYPHNVKGEGLDHCYDCSAEVLVLEEYIKKFIPDELSPDIQSCISDMSKEISARISKNRTLKDPNIDPEKRNPGVVKNQHIGELLAYNPRVAKDSSNRGKKKFESDDAEQQLKKHKFEDGGLGKYGQGRTEPVKLVGVERTCDGKETSAALFKDERSTGWEKEEKSKELRED
jgi:hypothetical protein